MQALGGTSFRTRACPAILRRMSDDFSEQVKRALAARAGNLCSNPECRALTSGPQDDPSKSVNLGVAAHITAASPGGPRYDPGLSPEERRSAENGIWLCQNCAKLVDNEPVRFTVGMLKKWKEDAEAEARNRVGKTAAPVSATAYDLKVNDRVRITPTVPRDFEQSHWMVIADKGRHFEMHKTDSHANINLPKSFIEEVHDFGPTDPSLVQLRGRLQWVSVKRRWVLFPEKPINDPGIGKDVDFGYPARRGIADGFKVAWCREDRLPQCLANGWHVFYDEDGKYLRVPGPDVAQILICDRP
jgi:hypothetical protein